MKYYNSFTSIIVKFFLYINILISVFPVFTPPYTSNPKAAYTILLPQPHVLAALPVISYRHSLHLLAKLPHSTSLPVILKQPIHKLLALPHVLAALPVIFHRHSLHLLAKPLHSTSLAVISKQPIHKLLPQPHVLAALPVISYCHSLHLLAKPLHSTSLPVIPHNSQKQNTKTARQMPGCKL